MTPEEIKNVPEVIYLQIDADGETPEYFKELEVSWCSDRIHNNDIEYILKSKYDALENRLKELAKVTGEIM